MARQNALGHLDPPGNGGHDQPARAGSARGPRRELSIAIERGAQGGIRSRPPDEAADLGDDEIRVLDAATLKPVVTAKLPLGSALNVGLLDDKSALVAWTTPNAPADLYRVDAASGAVSLVRHDARPSLGDLPPVEAHIEHVTSHDGMSIPVIVTLPTGASAGRKVPVMRSILPTSALWSQQRHAERTTSCCTRSLGPWSGLPPRPMLG